MSPESERNKRLEVLRRGIVPYAEAFQLQRALHSERVAGNRPDTLLLLTHPPVVTLGRGTHEENLRLTPEEYEERGIEVHETAPAGLRRD